MMYANSGRGFRREGFSLIGVRMLVTVVLACAMAASPYIASVAYAQNLRSTATQGGASQTFYPSRAYEAPTRQAVVDFFTALKNNDKQTLAKLYAGDMFDVDLSANALLSPRYGNDSNIWVEFRKEAVNNESAKKGATELSQVLRSFDYEVGSMRVIGNQLLEPTHVQVHAKVTTPLVAECETYATYAVYGAYGCNLIMDAYEIENSDDSTVKKLIDAYELGRDNAKNSAKDMVDYYYAALRLAMKDKDLFAAKPSWTTVCLDLYQDNGAWKVGVMDEATRYVLWGGTNAKVDEEHLGLTYKKVPESYTSSNPMYYDLSGEVKPLSNPAIMVAKEPVGMQHAGGVAVEIIPLDCGATEGVEVVGAKAGLGADHELYLTGTVVNKGGQRVSAALATYHQLKSKQHAIALPIRTTTAGFSGYGGGSFRNVVTRSVAYLDEEDNDGSGHSNAEGLLKQYEEYGIPTDTGYIVGTTVSENLNNTCVAYDLAPYEQRPFSLRVDGLKQNGVTIDDIDHIDLYVAGVVQMSELDSFTSMGSDFSITVDEVYYNKETTLRSGSEAMRADGINCSVYVHGTITNKTDKTIAEARPFLNMLDRDGNSLTHYSNCAKSARDLKPGETQEYLLEFSDGDWKFGGFEMMGVIVIL